MITLEQYKEQLDLCDAQIVRLLEQRLGIVETVAKYRKERELPLLQPEKGHQLYQRIEAELTEDKFKEHILDIYHSIVKESKKREAKTLFRDNIYMIGFMGCGKSTVSDYLGKILAMDVIEMDEFLAEKEGLSIPQIFEQYGETYWRNLETGLIRNMKKCQNTVISCGGGVPMRENNVTEMKKNGKIVLLTASPETILKRVRYDESRPLLKGRKTIQGISELMDVRRPKYEAAADIIVSTDGCSIHEIAEKIIYQLVHFSKSTLSNKQWR